MIKNICLLFFLATYVTAYVVTWTGDDDLTPTTTERPLLGREMCTRGPAYWCYNISQAKECHAVPHCISNVWEDMDLPEDNDSVCTICKDMVQQARDQLLSNETQDELRQVLEGSCRLIPLSIISNECVQLADQFIPELVDTLASRMDPQAVCAVSGLCNSLRIDEMLGELKPVDTGLPVRSGPDTRMEEQKFELGPEDCPKCKYYLGKAINYLQAMSKDEVRDKIFQICGTLGSYSDACRALTVSYMDSIYSHIQIPMESQELCGVIGLCDVGSIHRVPVGNPAGSSVRVWTPPMKDDDLPCDFCQQLVGHLKDWFDANTTRKEFNDIARGICKQTGQFRKECLNLVEQYGRTIYQLLIDETDPDRICEMIGVCPNQGRFQLFGNPTNGPVWTVFPLMEREPTNNNIDDDIEYAPMMDVLHGEKMAGNDERNAIEWERRVRVNAECQFCEYALHYLQTVIDDPSEKTQVKNAVDKLCNQILPHDMADQCNSFVAEYADAFIDLIAQEVDPSVICPKLGVCPAQRPMVVLATGYNVEDDQTGTTMTMTVPTCPLCHFAVSEAIHILGENRTREAIDEALDSVCYVLPKTIRPECLDFMTNYGNRIGEMLVIQLSAREICRALSLCVPSQALNAPQRIVVDSPLPLDRFMPQSLLTGEVNHLAEMNPGLAAWGDSSRLEAGKQCVICEFAIAQITQRLENNATEAEIRETVEHACLYLPRTVQTNCKNFVDTYSDLVVNYLADSLDPAQVCTKLGLC